MSVYQSFLFKDMEEERILVTDRTSTFVDNMTLPVHRWYRFSAGFSAEWAESVIKDSSTHSPARVFDPFAGSGTTLISAERLGCPSYGVEAHPFIYRIARAKLAHRTDPRAYRSLVREIRSTALQLTPAISDYPDLVKKCYAAPTLERLDLLRQALERQRDVHPAWELAWLTLLGILRMTAAVNTAQWQYILPNKKKKRSLDAFDAFDRMSSIIHSDMLISRNLGMPEPVLCNTDARTCMDVPDRFANLVITSPPYPNNFDYADATRLEMCFMGEIRGWGDLQHAVRRHLIRSCSQHVPEKTVDLDTVLSSPDLEPIRNEVMEVCQALARIRLHKGGKKTYHLMVACYFDDMAKVWKALRRVCDTPSRVCFVVGDSAPYGVYVPVIDWLMTLAQTAGFSTNPFEKTRDRNIKWKNRKHRVPLCEGRLWAEG